ncbi:MAG: efflux RND transporter periplasmic adaptor subunit [Smithella sp.]
MFKVSKKGRTLYGLTVAAVAVLAAWFLWKNHTSAALPVEEDIPLVRTMTVSPSHADQSYVYPGEVRGRYESQLAFQVSGKIVKRHVELGSMVKSGQILMQIDPRDIQQTVNIQSAQVDAAKSQLDLAEKNLKRYEQLFKEDVISRAQLERHQSAYDTAAAAWRQSRSQQTQGANQLGYSSLHADKSGVVSAINAEVGQVVGPGQPVVVLVQDGDKEIEISIPENRIKDIQDSPQIRVSFWALANCVVDGRIREIAPMADAVSRTYKVRISLLKPPPEVKLGMTASVSVFKVDSKTVALYIPLSALYQTQDTPSVWVVTQGTAHLRPIKTSAFGNSQIQVLSGINPGEIIVTAGVHKLREGQKVRAMAGVDQ